MRLNEKLFFELAKERGFEAADLMSAKSHSLSVSIYHGEVESLSQHDTCNVSARGILNGKFGAVTTEIIDKNTPEFLVDSIERTAKIIENPDPSIIFKGSKKYHKKSLYNKDLLDGNIREKVGILQEIERKLRAYDSRIEEVVTVGYDESYSEERLSNSYNLKLSQKFATYSYYAEVTAKQGEETRTGYKVFASYDKNEFVIDEFVKGVAEDALKKLGSTQCKSKKYPVILSPEAASILIKFLLGSLDAEEVQKHTSLFEGKLHQQVVSKKLTVIEDPLKKTLFFKYYDDEGVATNKKFLIKKGVVETYLYTLQTAMKDGVEPTGNGYRAGSKASAGTSLIVVKPGRHSEEEMIAGIKDGVYLTELEGLHSGMNAQSGNFSLQAAGFKITDGKLAEPLSLITVADNLINMFNNIKEIGNNSKLVLRNASECPSILIKKMAISGK